MDSWKTVAERCDRKERELRRRILSIPGSRRELLRLTKAGADQGRILTLLASAVTDTTWWHQGARRNKQNLESIANQLETVANHAQRISLAPSSYATFWLEMSEMGDPKRAKSAKERSPTWLFGLMRQYAKHCRDRAGCFSTLLKEYAPRQRRAMIDCLLLEVWLRTRQYHDKEVASLLTNAFEAAGLKRTFTEFQIQKHRQRYVVPRIEAYLEREAKSLKGMSGKDRLHRALQGNDFISSV